MDNSFLVFDDPPTRPGWVVSASPTTVTPVAKRLTDLALALTILILIAPLMIAIAVAIRHDSPGPILYRQRRTGKDGSPFTILKFRTMRDANDPQDRVIQARRNDRRVTRMGRILRRTSLDELPQILNVLRGEMSLVGPRPHAVSHDAYFAARIPGDVARYRVLPGVTGLAQISGLRGETETLEKMARRVAKDNDYIDNWSLWLDLRLIALTPLKGMVNPNAY